ncbi:MAG: hypothetical protein KAR18_07385 [Spirochaetes bacterium]|nr:hypothetical protein [Spirochaetota bacterium]
MRLPEISIWKDEFYWPPYISKGEHKELWAIDYYKFERWWILHFLFWEIELIWWIE